MFGYQENKYEVIDSFELSTEETGSDVLQQFEIRKEVLDVEEEKRLKARFPNYKRDHPYKTYIAIFGRNEELKKGIDILFFYKNENDLEDDWALFKSEPKLDISFDNIKAKHKVIGHVDQIGRDGSVIMW